MSGEFVVGILMTAALGSLSFFLARFISRHDEFEKDTRNSFRTIRNKIATHEVHVNQALDKVEKALENAGLDAQTKSRVNDLRRQVYSLQKTLKDDIVPMAKDISQNHGKVIVLEKQLQSQERKLKTMYEAVEILVVRKGRPPK